MNSQTGSNEDVLDVSVIVPTRNRRVLLRETLDALWSQTLEPSRFEIIVVDNCSDDGTAEMMAELQQTSPCKLSYHVMPVNRGPATSRNTAARMAVGRIIAFTDDDCRPDPRWLEKAVPAFENGSGAVGLVSGTVRYKPEQAADSKFFCRASGEVIDEHPTYTMSNSLYRRDVFNEVGGIDESLGEPDLRGRVVECGDTDLAWRVKKAGYSNVFVPEAIVYHELQELKPIDWVAEPFRLYVVNQLIRLHPNLRDDLLHFRLFFRIESIYFYLMVIGILLAISVSAWFLLFTIPYLWFCARLVVRPWSLSRIPKMVLQVGFLIARQCAMSAGFVYGTIRFRRLVL